MIKLKITLSGDRATTNQATAPTATELLRYSELTDAQFLAGIAYAKSQNMGYEYGTHPRWGNYLVLMPEQRTANRITAFEAAIK